MLRGKLTGPERAESAEVAAEPSPCFPGFAHMRVTSTEDGTNRQASIVFAITYVCISTDMSLQDSAK